MNRSYRITPVYTGDVSGVCSALYELGGMTVMHDPSGCNSTYNTHDETRWYDRDSLIFLSGLKNRDAVMGDDSHLINGVLEAAAELKPRFITLCNSPIPYINGTDFQAIGRIIEKKTQLPVLVVSTNGMHDYTLGAGEALKQVALQLVHYAEIKDMTAPAGHAKAEKTIHLTEHQVIPHSLNILGMTPLDFPAKGSVESLCNIIREHGWQLISNWAMNTSLVECQQAGRAQMNLVVSSVGLEAAKVLERKFGTPYVVGCPIGQFSQTVFADLERGQTTVSYIASHHISLDNTLKAEGNVIGVDGPVQDGFALSGGSVRSGKMTIIGEAVTMCSLAAAIELQQGIETQVLCPLETYKGLLRSVDIPVHGEEAVEELLERSRAVLADPLYKPLCSPEAEFFSLPHQAFSGRCFRKKEQNLFEWDVST